MNGKELPDIREIPFQQIESFLLANGEKKFRAKQVYEWLWKKNCRSFDQMTSLPASTRDKLGREFSFSTVTIEKSIASRDGTVKLLFRMSDGIFAEGVLIPSGDRTTACISSQSGCALGCLFCATGALGFTRSLKSYEIYDQVVLIRELSEKNHGIPLSNIVYMGMGEPLLNYEEVSSSVERITSPESLGMSPQRITISSVGIPKMIMRMADDDIRYHFALSLHAATDEKRDSIIPLNKKYPLAELSDAVKYFHKKTGKRITIEYILFRDFNDSLKDAADLALFCRSFPVKVNLIEYNPVASSRFRKPDPGRTMAFSDFLISRNMVVNIRKSRGEDIDAACGQLAGKRIDNLLNH